MLPRLKRKEFYYDVFHKGFVNTCMALTAVGGLALAYTGYSYFTQVIPGHKLLIQEKEKELLDEGKDMTESLHV